MGNSHPVFSHDEVASHNTSKSQWIIIDNKVYDVTNYKDHPAPFDVFKKFAGKDCTEDFHIMHHRHVSKAYAKMKDFFIGYVKH